MKDLKFKDVPGTYYQVSNYGDLKNTITGKLLTPMFNKRTGYLHYQYRKNTKIIWKYVHRLIWEVFKGEIPEGEEMDHIDNDRQNNYLGNLRCINIKENRSSRAKNKRGMKYTDRQPFKPRRVPTYFVYDYRNNYIGEYTKTEICEKYNMSRPKISNFIKRGKRRIYYIDNGSFVVYDQKLAKELYRGTSERETVHHYGKTISGKGLFNAEDPIIILSGNKKTVIHKRKNYDPKNAVPEYLIQKKKK